MLISQKSKKTELGDIPEEWNLFKLEEVCSIRKNNNPKSDLYIGLEQIGQGNNQLISKGDIRDFTSNKNTFLKGDVLYGKLRPLLNKVYLTQENGYCSTDILPLVVNDKLSNKILLWTLTSERFVNYAASNSSGTKMPRTNWNAMKNYLIPLGRMEEQQKIASILSNVDELIQKTEQIIEQTHKLKKGLMQRLLTKGIGHFKFKESEIGQIPFDWIISTIGQEFTVGSGGTPSRTNPNYFKGDIPWVKTTELDYNYIFETEEKITKEALKNSSAKFYPKDTFVIAMVGLEAEKTMGRCAILGIDATVNQACAAMQTHGRITIPFIFYYYQTLKRKILSIMAGTKRMNLNLELVKSIKIPVPSIEEQNKITNILKLMDSYLEKNNSTLLMIKNLKKGLMQQLLTGKIRVKV